MSDPSPLPVVYIGPSVPKLGLVRLRHYKALNPHIQAAIDKYPAMNLLFVPLDQFSTRSANIFANREASTNHAILSLIKAGAF